MLKGKNFEKPSVTFKFV